MISPKELGAAIGVSESSVKRWVDEGLVEAARTAGGHRRIAIDEAVRFIRGRGMPVINPEPLGLAELQGAPMEAGSITDRVDLLFELLKEGHADRARGVILAAYLAGEPMSHVCDQLVAPTMRRIGQLWEHARAGIFVEHRATDICLHALAQLRTLMPAPKAGSLIAVGGAPPHDTYTLPSLMVATTLHALGVAVHNLGAEVPADVMIEAVDACDANLAWLSVSVELPLELLIRYVEALSTQLADRHGGVIVGGRAWPDDLHPHQSNVQVAASMAELAAYVSGWRSAGRA
ncbi:MAG: hypothetical protein GC159_05530 [Phycisphaera sp.]|nr:hypothetical protein [Phycisphaera sp.]